MIHAAKSLSVGLELDTALRYAVTLAWEELTKPVEPRAIRIEYLCDPGAPLSHLSVWSVRARGYQDLVCDYRTGTTPGNQTGARFENGRRSAKLALTLDFVMNNQGHFIRLADASRHGLVLIYPPDAVDSQEASSGLGMMQAAGRVDHPQDEETLSPMDDDGYSRKCAASLPNATGYSDYEWSSAS